MAEKSPRELLRETIERSAREVASWPAWMRGAVSTEGVFRVQSTTEGGERERTENSCVNKLTNHRVPRE